MHLDEKEVMVAGGKYGNLFNDFDDKNFVYKFENDVLDGEWIGTGNVWFSIQSSEKIQKILTMFAPYFWKIM